MTRKVGDSLPAIDEGTFPGGDIASIADIPDARCYGEMAPGQMAAIRGPDKDFWSLDGIAEGMRGDLRRRDRSAAQRPMSEHIDAVKQAWSVFDRAGNLRGGNAVESGTGARRIGSTNASPEAPSRMRARRRRSTRKKEEGSWVG